MRNNLLSGLLLAVLVLGCSKPAAEAPKPAPVAQPPASEPSPAGAAAQPPAEQGTPKLVITESAAPKDPVAVTRFEVKGNTLEADVSHSGGCAQHTYSLAWGGKLQDPQAAPPVAELVLVHDAHGDQCEALLTVTRSFDLSPLAEHLRAQGRAQGTVQLRVFGSDSSARYNF